MTIVDSIRQSVIDGDNQKAADVVGQALAQGIAPLEILNEGLIPAMSEVGQRFECGDFYLQEMLLAARAMKAGVAVLAPHLRGGEIKPTGKVVLGTVKGDLHDVGKNLVATMLESVGFAVVDLGTDVAPEKFVAAVREHRPDVVGLSALLTVTMSAMKGTIEALETAQLRDSVRVIIGGAPVTAQYAGVIGADGYAPDASRAAKLAATLAAQRADVARGTPSAAGLDDVSTQIHADGRR